MITAAAEHQVAPDAFGYGDGVTPAVLATLAGAGLKDDGDLTLCTEAGLIVSQAAELVPQG